MRSDEKRLARRVFLAAIEDPSGGITPGSVPDGMSLNQCQTLLASYVAYIQGRLGQRYGLRPGCFDALPANVLAKLLTSTQSDLRAAYQANGSDAVEAFCDILAPMNPGRRARLLFDLRMVAMREYSPAPKGRPDITVQVLRPKQRIRVYASVA